MLKILKILKILKMLKMLKILKMLNAYTIFYRGLIFIFVSYSF
jgi:hypothetical protein